MHWFIPQMPTVPLSGPGLNQQEIQSDPHIGWLRSKPCAAPASQGASWQEAGIRNGAGVRCSKMPASHVLQSPKLYSLLNTVGNPASSCGLKQKKKKKSLLAYTFLCGQIWYFYNNWLLELNSSKIYLRNRITERKEEIAKSCIPWFTYHPNSPTKWPQQPGLGQSEASSSLPRGCSIAP